ncbi:MAG: MlaD family protein [Bacteroides sp.]|nr:MlaD family protein [Bacteroides sp.]
MKFFTKEVRIGIAGLVVLAMLIFGINYLKGINLFKPSAYYYVKYTDINGLAQSSPVFADGYRVGTVHGIQYDYTHPGHVTVQVEVDTRLRVPKGSRAELESEMLGGVRMNLVLPRNAGEFHQVGDTIPGVLNSGILDALTDGLKPQLESMLPKLDSILHSLNVLLADENIPATLNHARGTMANLEGLTAQMNHLFCDDIPQLTGKFNVVGENLVSITNNLKDVDYAAVVQKADSTLYNVKLFTEQLTRRDNSIGLLLTDPGLYNNLNATVGNASLLLEDLRQNPKRYVHFSLFGRKSN